MELLITILIGLHNILRWVWVVAAVLVLFAAYRGWLQKRPYTPQDRRYGVIFVSLMDLQLLIGGILYFIGNWGVKAFGMDGGRSATFFAVEHAPTMIVALIVAHVASARVKRMAEDVLKHRISAILFTVVVLIVLFAIPWATRPLLPSF